uniref:Prostaglandin endoperoxide synthase n=1 Tax=Gracilaria vermiculophylla TaxID=2608709 RepID=I6VVK9_9FLOR|nr:prostaglandin endoperoxide synthase [Gracilaria vermiculophylla]
MVFNNFRNLITRCGGLGNTFSMWLRANFKPFWAALQNIPVIKDVLNQFYLSALLKKFIKSVPRLPNHNLRNDFPSLYTVYDESRTTYSRLLPRQPEYTEGLPDLDLASSCFLRENFVPETNRNLSLLIGFYAQWFSHQFFNTNPEDHTKVNQPVGINLGQLYGSTAERMKSLRSGKLGLLKSSVRNGLEFPPIIPIPKDESGQNKIPIPGDEMFDIPFPMANSIPCFAAVHVIFFRRHQYVCRELAKWASANGKTMSDEEMYQKAKIIVAINVLRLTMHDYVAEGLQSSHVKIKFDHKVKKSLIWKFFGPGTYHPSNAIQTEFNFLYRWHQFIPEEIKVVKDLPVSNNQDMKALVPDIDKYDNDSLTFPDPDSWFGEDWNAVKWLTEKENGLERLIFSAASQRAGKLTLLNTNKWLVKNVIKPGMKKCREYELASYNDYREHFGFRRVKKFEQITTDAAILAKLKQVYKDVDQVEYYPGIFAENKDFGGVHGPFLAAIGVGMTYCGIFASRLFETDIFNEKTLTSKGVELANEINYIRDVTRMHTNLGEAKVHFTVPKNNPV